MKTLKELLRMQRAAATAINGAEPRPTRNAVAQQALGLISEVAELTQELNWKPWKKDKPVDKAKALGELADVWIFTMNLTDIVVKATGAADEDVEAAIIEKIKINLVRAEGNIPGYGRKEEGYGTTKD